MDEILDNDEDETTWEYIGTIQDDTIPETIDCILYYLTGFICKKLYNSTKCLECRKDLYHKVERTENTPASKLTNLKSRGWLNHPNIYMFNIFIEVEKKLMLHIRSVDVFDETIEDFFSSNSIIFPSFPCELHKQDIISRAIFFYITMRVKQFYKQESQKIKKASSEKRKQSKLLKT